MSGNPWESKVGCSEIADVPMKRERVLFSKIPSVIELPSLIEIQHKSYQWFLEEGLLEAFRGISPVQDFTGNLVLEFTGYALGEPKHTEEECKRRDVTYSAPLNAKVRLISTETGEVKEQEVFMGDFPLMTQTGTFIINGAERVVVINWRSRAYFEADKSSSGKRIYMLSRTGDMAGIRDLLLILLGVWTARENYQRQFC